MDALNPPPGYVAEKYDLTDADSVIRLGKDIGHDWMEQLMPAVKAMPMEQRVLFYSALVAPMAGHMSAAIGWEAAHAVLDTLKMMCHGLPASGDKQPTQQ